MNGKTKRLIRKTLTFRILATFSAMCVAFHYTDHFFMSAQIVVTSAVLNTIIYWSVDRLFESTAT